MTTKKKIKTRLLRLWVTIRGGFLKWSIMAMLAVIFAVGAYRSALWCLYTAKYAYHAYILDDLHDICNYCYELSDELCYYENGPHSYIRDKMTNDKVVRDIFWVAGTLTDDSLLCFAKDGYRGFLNRHTGEVVIPADRYRKAWLFSEGLAAVMRQDSSLVFIDTSGRKAVDPKVRFTSKAEGHSFLFNKGYCALVGPDGYWGLIDHSGNWAVKPQYDDLLPVVDGFWVVEKDGMMGMIDNKLRLVADTKYRDVRLTTKGIEAMKPDFTRELLSFDGRLIHPFTYTRIEDLSYKTECEDEDYDSYSWKMSPYKAYYTTYEMDDSVRTGLLGPDGIPVTPPIFCEIRAVSENCFRGFYTEPSGDEGMSVLFNNKGKVISPPE